MLDTAPLRVLNDRDVAAALAVCDTDPVANVVVASRIQLAGLDPWRLGAEVWGFASGGRLRSLCYAGANLVPVSATEEAVRQFAEKARRQGRRCSSIVGPADMVAEFWRLVRAAWGPARDVRPHQPLMALATKPFVEGDPGVRRVRPDELDTILPACIAMFTEEVGVSPTIGDGGALYRAKVAELIESGRAYARIEGDRVVFKAEIGAVTKDACQVQGVWVDPTMRGRGLAAAGMAAVVEEALRSVAPVVSLYVNDYNVAARRAYAKVGFRDIGGFMSVLF